MEIKWINKYIALTVISNKFEWMVIMSLAFKHTYNLIIPECKLQLLIRAYIYSLVEVTASFGLSLLQTPPGYVFCMVSMQTWHLFGEKSKLCKIHVPAFAMYKLLHLAMQSFRQRGPPYPGTWTYARRSKCHVAFNYKTLEFLTYVKYISLIIIEFLYFFHKRDLCGIKM